MTYKKKAILKLSSNSIAINRFLCVRECKRSEDIATISEWQQENNWRMSSPVIQQILRRNNNFDLKSGGKTNTALFCVCVGVCLSHSEEQIFFQCSPIFFVKELAFSKKYIKPFISKKHL